MVDDAGLVPSTSFRPSGPEVGGEYGPGEYGPGEYDADDYRPGEYGDGEYGADEHGDGYDGGDERGRDVAATVVVAAPMAGAHIVQDAPAATRAEMRIDFGAHLEANYRRLVAQLYAITLDATEAHAVVQDAYSRAWRSWATLSRSADPTGWVRRVAVRSTIRSWRRWRRGVRRPVESSDARMSALLEALRQLTAAERRCVVLHHMAGSPVREIATVEGVSVGTVVARLARAQQVVTDGLADGFAGAFGPGDPDAAYRRSAPGWDVPPPAAPRTGDDHEEGLR